MKTNATIGAGKGSYTSKKIDFNILTRYISLKGQASEKSRLRMRMFSTPSIVMSLWDFFISRVLDENDKPATFLRVMFL